MSSDTLTTLQVATKTFQPTLERMIYFLSAEDQQAIRGYFDTLTVTLTQLVGDAR